MANVLTFERESIEHGTFAIVPFIDGTSLADLVTAYEQANGFTDPAGGYGGIALPYANIKTLSAYLMGEEDTGDLERGTLYTLFCECGEPGCWPLLTHIHLDPAKVVWMGFAQPHRPKRDYRNFGPFTFSRAQYDVAVVQASALYPIT